jgi:hypothetical protein
MTEGRRPGLIPVTNPGNEHKKNAPTGGGQSGRRGGRLQQEVDRFAGPYLRGVGARLCESA